MRSDDETRDIARLRLAAVLLDEKNYDEALKLAGRKHVDAFAALLRRAQRRHPRRRKARRRRRAQRIRLALERATPRARYRALDPAQARCAGRGAMRIACCSLAALVALPSLARMRRRGCPGDIIDYWFGQRQPVQKPAELVDFKPTATARMLWQEAWAMRERYVFSPALVGRCVYAAGAAGRSCRFDAAHRQASSGASTRSAVSRAASARRTSSFWSAPARARCSRSTHSGKRCG